MEVPEDLGRVKTGVLKTPFTECWKSFPEDDKYGVLFFFRADEHEGCYFLSARTKVL